MSDATSRVVRIPAGALVKRLPTADGRGPAYRQLAERIRTAVLDGRLTSGVGMPSERDLAARLRVSRTTVAAAYEMLRSDGWLVSRRGAVSRLRVPRSATAWRTDIWGHLETGDGGTIDLSVASLPAPREALRAAVAAAAEALEAHLPREGYHPYGLPELRRVVAHHYERRGVATSADQILITNGAQHGLALVVGTQSSPGDRVMIESPTYPVAIDAIRAAPRVMVPVALDATGMADGEPVTWDLELLTTTLRRVRPTLGYLVTEFHNPTGAVMPAETREALVAHARRTDTVLVVDESFRDVAFDGPESLPPMLAGFGDPSHLISLGSMSKPFWGGLRIGWVRAAAAMIERLAKARSLGDMAGPVLDQLVAQALLADPEPALRTQIGRLETGSASLRAALTEHLPAWRATAPRGGVSSWVRLPGPYADELVRHARDVGVNLVAGSRFGLDGTMDAHLRLPYTLPPEELTEAVVRLARIDDAAAGSTVHGDRPSGWLA